MPRGLPLFLAGGVDSKHAPQRCRCQANGHHYERQQDKFHPFSPFTPLVLYRLARSVLLSLVGSDGYRSEDQGEAGEDEGLDKAYQDLQGIHADGSDKGDQEG